MTENEYYGYGKMTPPAWCPIPNKEEMKTGVKSISITDIPSGVVCGWCWCNMNEHRVVHTSDRGIKQYRCVLCKRVCV